MSIAFGGAITTRLGKVMACCSSRWSTPPCSAPAFSAASDNTGERQRLLESIATGETVMTLAHQEQDARNEYQVQLHSSARRVADGWALNGQKHRVFHGGVADSFLVSAILEDSNETALFVVDRAAVGMTANTYELIDGSRAADLHLQDVQVTDANLLLRGAAVQQAIEAGLDRADSGAVCCQRWLHGSGHGHDR